jgi:uncharacterized membrane protein
MSDLVAIEFATPADAFAFRAELVKSQQDYLISLDDAVVVTREAGGKVQLHQAVNLTATGALSGAFWGTLIGMLFLNPLLGAAVGAGSGALAGVASDFGISDATMTDFGQTLPEGGAAVFALIRKVNTDKLLAGLQGFRGKGRVVRSSLTEEQDQRIRALLEAPVPVATATSAMTPAPAAESVTAVPPVTPMPGG